MASISLDLQRRFEQRWAAKFFFRPDTNAPKTQELETHNQQQAQPAKATEKLAGLGGRVSGLHQRCERETDKGRLHSARGVNMTDDQVNRIVEHHCEQLHATIRGAQSEVFPPNASILLL